MAIATVDDLVASTKRPFLIYKNSTLPTVAAGNFYSYWGAASVPVAGSFAVGNTTAGVIPTQATTGAVGEFVDPSGNNAYLARITAMSGQIGAVLLYDRCWHAGTYTCAATGSYGTTGTAVTRPSSGAGVEIWIEVATAINATGNVLNCTYTNQAGTAGQTTANLTMVASATAGRMFKFTLAAGDSGVQQVTAMTAVSGGTTGTFNVILMRKISTTGATLAGASANSNWAELALPQVYAGSCLFVVFLSSGATAPTIYFDGTVAYN